MLKEYYAVELIAAESESREALVPSYRAFVYWAKKLVPAQILIRKQKLQDLPHQHFVCYIARIELNYSFNREIFNRWFYEYVSIIRMLAQG